MDILITGGTGFIGKSLCARLQKSGHRLTVLSRKPDQVSRLCGAGCRGIGSLKELDDSSHFDAIINLSGESIAGRRWSERRKAVLRESRIKVTRGILEWIERSQSKAKVLISGSAIGYYGDQGDCELLESSPPSDDFGHRLCAEWEAAAQKAEELGLRVCLIRIGLVIGAGGGFLQPMLIPFKFGFGGPIADGRQWMSWIQREDLIGIIQRLLDDATIRGPVNATAPNPVINRDFTQTLARILRRPALLPLPRFVLALLLGEMSTLLTGGQRVLPGRLLDAGFEFRYPELEGALREALDRLQ